MLASFYRDFIQKEKGKNFEIVFVSSDRDNGSFAEYFSEMPWLALPFADRDRKQKLSQQFRVTGIPCLVILGPDGQLITSEGVEDVSNDPEGANFPWKPIPFAEAFSGPVEDNHGDKLEIKELQSQNDYIGLYFSASWCGPCQAATPGLIKVYNTLREKGHKFELIFASRDEESAAHKDYFGKMPWKAFSFKDARVNALAKHFEIEGIPSLVILDKNGAVVNSDAMGSIDDIDNFPWKPKPLQPVGSATSKCQAQGIPLVLGMFDTDSKEKAFAALSDVATKYEEKHQAKGDPNARKEFGFFYVTPEDRLFDTVTSRLDGKPLPSLMVYAPSLDEPAVFDRDGFTSENITAFLQSLQL